jgi:S-adenosylmethionine hydrolase
MRTNEDMAIRPIITLTTDFGLSDPYVAAMKGVILGLNPEAAVVDVTHEVRPQRLIQAVFVTQAAWPAFPAGAVHVVVVDPGVGSARQGIVLVTPQGCFLGPDNGVLSAALPDEARPPSPREGASVAAPESCSVFTLTNHRYLRHPVSATFHGRDVFAPAAAHISLGVPPEALGEPVEALIAFPPLRASRSPDGALQAQVVHIDRFGNVITDVRGEDLPADAFTVELTGQLVPGPVRTYAEASGLVALVGSGGYLEVVLVGGSAADALHIEIGDPALLRPAS